MEPLIEQLGYNQGVLKINLKDLSHEDSLVAPSRGGNCINWVVGHVAYARNNMLKILGKEALWDDDSATPYQRGSKPLTAENALTLTEIIEKYDAAQEAMIDALKGLSADEFAAKSPVSIFKGDEETVASAITFMVFHETYHVGQTGLLRRVAGKEGAIQ